MLTGVRTGSWRAFSFRDKFLPFLGVSPTSRRLRVNACGYQHMATTNGGSGFLLRPCTGWNVTET